jgi:hypothetical protein
MANRIITQTIVYIGMRTMLPGKNGSCWPWKISLLPYINWIHWFSHSGPNLSGILHGSYNDIIRETFQFWWQNATVL